MTQLERFLEKKTHIIWDWNGTLLDDVDLCVRTMATILQKYELTPIDKEAYRRCFSFPVMEYYRSLGFDFEKFSFQVVGDEWMAFYRNNVHSIKLHKGAFELLKKLQEKGLGQSILSAAKESHLLEQLRHFGILEYFDHVLGISDHYAKGKVERGRELMKLLSLDKSEIVLIGDTDHDHEVAAALGIDAILLADGHQHPDRFQHLGRTIVYDRHFKV